MRHRRNQTPHRRTSPVDVVSDDRRTLRALRTMLAISIARRAFGLSARPFCTQAEDGKTLSDALLTCLRVSHATEAKDMTKAMLNQRVMCDQETMCSFMEGQEWSLGGRIDAEHFRNMASENLSRVQNLHRHHDAPISVLVPLLRPAGFLFGAAVVHAPKSLRMAVYGALQDSVSDGYNDHIRTVLELQPTQRYTHDRSLRV